MAKIVTTPSLTKQQDYINGFEYFTDYEEVFNRLEHFAMDEGRPSIRPSKAGLLRMTAQPYLVVPHTGMSLI